MCVSPLTIVNPSRWIDPSGSQQLLITVPCGHCSECVASKRLEWEFRLYYEQLSAYADNMYCIFDTLTYDNAHLPHLSDFGDVPKNLDFACFSLVDIQLFLKRLRKNLGVKIRYFIASEYGADQRYSHRPHYHCLFFVPNSVNPIDFSRCVARSWNNGRTDGVPFRSAQYVLGNVFHGYHSRVSNYVLKYVSKSQSYCDLVRDRLDLLRSQDSFLADKLKNQIKMFHCQSLGCGYDFISRLYKPEQLVNMITLPVFSATGVKHMAFPLSFRRKFFYKYHRDGDRVIWTPLSYLVDYLNNTLRSRIVAFAHRLSELLSWKDSLSVSEFVFTKRFRFNDLGSDMVANQFAVEGVGLRNYASRDRIVKSRCFANKDYGSEKEGYQRGITFIHVPFSDDDVHYTTLFDLMSCVMQSDFVESTLSKLYALRADDPSRKVELVKDRVVNLFKSLQLC